MVLLFSCVFFELALTVGCAVPSSMADVMSSLNRRTALVEYDEKVRRLLAGTGERVRRRELPRH